MNLTCPSPGVIKPLIGTGNYVLSIVKFPELSFFVQDTELPTISIGSATQGTPLNDFPIPGDKLSFGPLVCTMVIDEKLNNFNSIHAWMTAMGFPESHQQYKDFITNSATSLSMTELAKGYTDATLTIMGNNNRPVMQARFVDCFPISMSGVRFSSTNTEASQFTVDVTFAYSHYSLSAAT